MRRSEERFRCERHFKVFTRRQPSWLCGRAPAPPPPNQRGTHGAVRLRHARSDKQASESLVRGALDVAAGGSLSTALLDHSEQGFSFLLGF